MNKTRNKALPSPDKKHSPVDKLGTKSKKGGVRPIVGDRYNSGGIKSGKIKPKYFTLRRKITFSLFNIWCMITGKWIVEEYEVWGDIHGDYVIEVKIK